MANPYYNNSGAPVTGSVGLSTIMRSEFAAVAVGFGLLPQTLTPNALVVVNGAGTALTATASPFTLGGPFSTTGAFSTTLVQGANVTLTLPIVNGTFATLAGTETLTNKTLTAPAINGAAIGTSTITAAILSGTFTGTYTLAGTPTITAPSISGATITTSTLNGLTVTSSTGTLTIANLKTLTVSNTMTLQATDGATVIFGAGGTVSYGGGAAITALTGDVTASGTGSVVATVAKIGGTTVGGSTGTGNVVFSASPTLSGTLNSGAIVVTSNSNNALVVGQNGTSNPALNIDASTASSVTGLNVKSAASGGGLALQINSSNAAENLKLDARGTGTITLASVSTGGITMSTTTTFADSGTWGSTGINALTKLGIGMTATHILDITQTQNAFSSAVLLNANTGTLGAAGFVAQNSASHGYMVMNSTGFTTSGQRIADAMWIASDGGGGLGIGTTLAAHPLWFFINDAEAGRFGTDKSFLVGSTTNAGAGYIAATGDVISFYSDDRLKTRTGKIEGALDKVMTLDAFFYEPNATARALGYDHGRDVGLSAQQMKAIMPELIARAPIDSEIDYMTIRYHRTTALLVAAIQDLKNEIDALRAERRAA